MITNRPGATGTADAVTATACPGCGARLVDAGGAPTLHDGCSPACGRLFDAVLECEYADPEYFVVHGLTVSSWRLQHPAGASARSTAVHLARLGLYAEGARPERLVAVVQSVSERFRHDPVPPLAPPADRGAITIADVAAATTAAEHCALVRAWAGAVWAARSADHPTVRSWLARQRGG